MGFLIDGRPSRFPSINTRSERLQDRPGGLRGRAIVPATRWFELQKPAGSGTSSVSTAPCSAWRR